MADVKIKPAMLRIRGLSKSLATMRSDRSVRDGLAPVCGTVAAARIEQVLEDITFDVQAGEVVCILGPSGCGKSTLLRTVAGVWRPDSPVVDGHAAYEMSPSERTGIAWMPQRSPLVQSRVVWKNVAIGALVRGRQGRSARAVALEYLEVVGLSEWAHAFPHELSGGMQQRVALARTLASEPQILLLDEPLSSLDVMLRQRIAQRLRDYARARAAVVLITTHTVEESIAFANRVLILSGRPSRITARVSLDKTASTCALPSGEIICATQADMFSRVYDALRAGATTSEDVIA